MAKSALSLLLVAAALFALAQLGSGEQQQQNLKVKSSNVDVQQKSEQVQERIMREADPKKKKRKAKNGKCPNGKKGKKCRKERYVDRKIKRTRNNKCQKGKRCTKRGKNGRKTNKTKKKKSTSSRNNDVATEKQITCPTDLLVKLTINYRKYRNNLNQVRRIVRNCGLMEKKKKNSMTVFEKAGEATCTKDKHANISKELLACNVTAAKLCTPPETKLANCTAAAITNYEKCEVTLNTYLTEFGKCLKPTKTNAEFCTCVAAIANPPEAVCLDFKAMDTKIKEYKTNCTKGTEKGSFGYCRKLQIEAADDANCAPCNGRCCPNQTDICCNPLTGCPVSTSATGGRKKMWRKNLVKNLLKN